MPVLNTPADTSIPRSKAGIFGTNRVAGTYDLFVATGDVYVEVLSAYVKAAGSGYTSISIATNHTSPKSVVASTPVANVTLDSSLSLVTTSFLLPSGKKIQGTIVGTGTGGEVNLIVRFTPVTPGATLTNF